MSKCVKCGETTEWIEHGTVKKSWSSDRQVIEIDSYEGEERCSDPTCRWGKKKRSFILDNYGPLGGKRVKRV